MNKYTKCQWKPELHNGEPCPIHNTKYENFSEIGRFLNNKNKLYENVKRILHGTQGEEINKKIRNNEKLNSHEQYLYNSVKEGMDTLEKPIHIYRTDMTDIWNAKPGDIINQKGFLYGSVEADKTKEEDRDKYKVFSNIITNKDTKLITTNYAEETEIILEDNLKYKVLSKSEQLRDKNKVICYTLIVI